MNRLLIKTTVFLLLIQISYAAVAGINNKAVIEIKVIVGNKDTGTFELRFPGRFLQASLQKGQASFHLSIEHTSEMLLFTNLHVRDMDDSSIIRFLAEPRNITLQFDIINGIPHNLVITGSATQKELEAWNLRHQQLWQIKERAWSKSGQLGKLRNGKDSLLIRKQTDSLDKITDFAYTVITKDVLLYVQSYPGSYLSGYLLYKYHRRITTDSLEAGYQLLSRQVRDCHFSIAVLDYLFTLSTDNFRKKHNNNGVAADLDKATSLFSFTLTDTAKQPVNLSRFRGKPTVLYFWATWCGFCHKLAPSVDSVIKEFSKNSIQFVSISQDKDDDYFKKPKLRIHLPCITLVDNQNLLRYYYRFLYLPRIILLDENGKVIGDDLDINDLRNKLKAFNNHKAGKTRSTEETTAEINIK